MNRKSPTHLKDSATMPGSDKSDASTKTVIPATFTTTTPLAYTQTQSFGTMKGTYRYPEPGPQPWTDPPLPMWTML
ncbi:hypothetical protein BDZ91DRAFT_733737, partial [Kalaharituber pfeilii]